MRIRHFDTRFIKLVLNQLVEQAPYRPLLAGQRCDHDTNDDRAVGQFDNAGHFHIADDERGHRIVFIQLLERFLKLGNGIVDIFAIGDAIFPDVTGEAAHVVGDLVHRRERNDVVGTVSGADGHRADRHTFNRTVDARYINHIPRIQRILQLDEDTGNDVLDQRLRPETDR